jgi:AcrR family transcriptional regulator
VTTTTAKPRGRRPGNTDTRGSILEAALRLFSHDGYDKVSLRAIAREADVDPALVHHYFESKADLFARAVLDIEFDPDSLLAEALDGPTESLGHRVALALLRAWERPGIKERTSAMIRAAVNDEGARRPLAEFLSKELFVKLAQHFGHSDARQRAQLALATLLGVIMVRDILRIPPNTRSADLARGLGRALQQYLVEPWA